MTTTLPSNSATLLALSKVACFLEVISVLASFGRSLVSPLTPRGSLFSDELHPARDSWLAFRLGGADHPGHDQQGETKEEKGKQALHGVLKFSVLKMVIFTLPRIFAKRFLV